MRLAVLVLSGTPEITSVIKSLPLRISIIGPTDFAACGLISALGLAAPVIGHRCHRAAENGAHISGGDKFARVRLGGCSAAYEASKHRDNGNSAHEGYPSAEDRLAVSLV
jgi:hypothetical protein